MRWVFVGLIVLFLLSTFFFVRSDFFAIKSVNIQLDKITCANSDQIKNSSDLLGQNIFLINSSKVIRDLKVKFLCIKDIKFSRYFPNRVNLFASGREAKAILLGSRNLEATQSSSLENIATPSAERLEGIEGLEVDEEGVIFAKSTNEADTPKVYYFREDLAVGQKVPTTIFESLKILEKVKSYGLDVKENEILDRIFLIYPQMGTPRIVFKLGENLESQLASLQLILNQAKIDENILEFIDLRFDKPTIRLAPKKNGKR